MSNTHRFFFFSWRVVFSHLTSSRSRGSKAVCHFLSLPPDVLRHCIVQRDPLLQFVVRQVSRHLREVLQPVSLRGGKEPHPYLLMAQAGWVPLLQFYFPPETRIPRDLLRKLATAASGVGSVAVLEWLFRKVHLDDQARQQTRPKRMNWNARTRRRVVDEEEVEQEEDLAMLMLGNDSQDAAAAGGHLHALQWIHAHLRLQMNLAEKKERTKKAEEQRQAREAQDEEREEKPNREDKTKTMEKEKQATTTKRKLELSPSLLPAAAAIGRQDIVEWALTHGIFFWGGETCRAAASGGHLQLLQWLHGKGCPWDYRTCEGAAAGGHMDLLQWARTKGCAWNACTCAAAASSGHLQLLQWARANGCSWDSRTCSRAAANGHLQVLQWARANGCSWDTQTCSHAARNGHLPVLQWARANGCSWDEHTCSEAAAGGHLQLLQWARTNGCIWTPYVCFQAASGGHLELLQWALANGCIWDARVCTVAAGRGHLRMLQWCVEDSSQEEGDSQAQEHNATTGCVEDSQQERNSPQAQEHNAISNGCSQRAWNAMDCVVAAAESGHLPVLQWAHERGHIHPGRNKGKHKHWVQLAELKKRRDVLRWARQMKYC
jgi:hypothetical protein